MIFNSSRERIIGEGYTNLRKCKESPKVEKNLIGLTGNLLSPMIAQQAT
jgi:hypothetical protein